MDIKKVKKQQLYDFIESQVANQIELVEKEITQKIDEALNDSLSAYVQLSELGKDISKLADNLQVAQEKYKVIDSWDITRLIQTLNSKASLEQIVKDEMKRDVRNYVRGHKTRINTGIDQIDKIAQSLFSELKPFYKKIDDLKQLGIELTRAVELEANGTKGYKALVALGVDMSGLEVTSTNLPAVIKLSVNPALLAGGN